MPGLKNSRLFAARAIHCLDLTAAALVLLLLLLAVAAAADGGVTGPWLLDAADGVALPTLKICASLQLSSTTRAAWFSSGQG
jgi:hypothetical protein